MLRIVNIHENVQNLSTQRYSNLLFEINQKTVLRGITLLLCIGSIYSREVPKYLNAWDRILSVQQNDYFLYLSFIYTKWLDNAIKIISTLLRRSSSFLYVVKINRFYNKYGAIKVVHRKTVFITDGMTRLPF